MNPLKDENIVILGAAGAGEVVASPSESDALAPARIAALYPKVAAPGTGRAAYQLTAGPATCYPLYYFIPSITQDGRYLIYHRRGAGEVQLHRLDLATGESVALTAADDPAAGWLPWDTDPGKGILDHRSALNVARSEVIYFAHGEARAVHLETLADRALFSLPPGRKATGQNCVSPDGRYFSTSITMRNWRRKCWPPAGPRPATCRAARNSCASTWIRAKATW